jgi:AAA family ATP:ADP antiporter
VERGARYKAKNFIDTLVFRAGDAMASWVYAGLKGLGLGLPAIAAIAVPLAAVWALLGLRLGRAAEHRGEATTHSTATRDQPTAPGDPP